MNGTESAFERAQRQFKEAQEKHKAKRAFPFVWLKDAKVDFTNTDLIKGLIPSSSLILAYGPSGDGKTFWTIDTVFHIAAGIQWRSCRTRQAMVVYVAAEAGTSIVRRFVAIRGESEEDVPLVIVTKGANLLDMADVDLLVEQLEAFALERGIPVGLVVFDTYSRSMPGGDENGSVDGSAVVAAADRIRNELGASTLFVHHSGKDTERGARGWSGLYAAADTVFNVRDKVVKIEKSRDGASDQEFPFALKVMDLGEDSDGDMLTTCLVEQLDVPSQPKKQKPLPANATTAFMALRESIEESGQRLPTSTSIPYPVVAVSISTWRDRFKLRYGSDEPESTKKAFQRAKQDLLKHGLIQISDPNVWIV